MLYADAAATTPAWVEWLFRMAGLVGPVAAYVLGNAKKTGAEKYQFETMKASVESMQKVLADTLQAVAAHGASIMRHDGQLADLDGQLRGLRDGMATLLERTKKL